MFIMFFNILIILFKMSLVDKIKVKVGVLIKCDDFQKLFLF